MKKHAEQGPASQKFFLVVNLVRKIPVEVLVQKLKAGTAISKEQVLRESEQALLSDRVKAGLTLGSEE